MRIGIISVVFMLAASACGAAPPEGIVVEVTGGKIASFDRVVERELNLEAAGKLLGRTAKVDPQSVRVMEIGPAGDALATMASQVDAADKPGSYIVCWQAAGELGAGQTRKFEIVLDGQGPIPGPAQPITAVTDGNITTVTSGKTKLTYSKGSGGMLTGVTVEGASGQFWWADKIFDGAVYYLATHPASSVSLLSSGPLRAVYETKSVYSGAPSNPKAVYRFTHYAGEPGAHLTAEVTQDYGHTWLSLHFVEIQFDNAPITITHYATDLQSGRLNQSGDGVGAKEWAALYGEDLLLGVCDSSSPYIYNGGGKHYGAYVRSGVAPMTALSYAWKCALYFGGGSRDIPALAKWSTAVSDAPATKVTLRVLDSQITKLTALSEQQQDKLSRLDGRDWASAYIRTYIAGSKLREASDAASRGAFGVAAKALAETQAALEGRAGGLRVLRQGSVLSGAASGYPFLLNRRVAYFWSLPEQGTGLISIYDRQKKREFLNIAPASASFWQASVKNDTGGKSYTSTGTACKVDLEKGRLKFAWGGSFGVQAEARLAPDESRLRLRLTAAAQAVDEGILNVTFPVVAGIVPITAGAAGDVVLNTRGIGNLVPSPLVSGAQVEINYPAGMQFTALQGNNIGLFFADEDREANRKSMQWSPENTSGSLIFTITRPVLGWGGKELVKTYASPGDAVIGPFIGDWYDAAQLYRRWAITAPWTAKGPIHIRNDIPKWFSEATYWTMGSLNSIEGVNGEIEKHAFLGPGGIFHAYYQSLAPNQDNLYPEIFPPRIGSEGFRNAVKNLQEKGIRVVPYINGWCWDQDTESYRTLQAAEKGQIMSSAGGVETNASYGGGTQLAQMCPGTKLWQDKLIEICCHGVASYGLDGWYLDFLTIHTSDCFNPNHGHPIAGGNYWTQSIRKLYSRLRSELKAINPDVMMTGEDNAEFVIDLFDAQLVLCATGTKAPIYQAVYHDYSLIWGGGYNQTGPCVQGRWWLMGNQNGWHNIEGAYANPPEGQYAEFWRKEGAYYLRLLRCHREFGLPYLAYGRMLRMPRITTDLPIVTCPSQAGNPSYTVPAVEGTAWQAPDKTVGIFFLNYSEEPQEFTWAMDLAEAVGWGAGDKLRLSRWAEEGGLQTVAEIRDGKLTRSEKMEGRGIMALKLEVIR